MTAPEPPFFAKARRANRIVVDGQSNRDDAVGRSVLRADDPFRASKARP